MNNTGWILIHRKIQDSEIWKKPDSWLKIWIYLLQCVSYEDKKYHRGTYYFRFEWIARDCNVSYDTVRRCVEWLRDATQIATQKATHGIIITVLNYAKYQDKDFIESQTESHETAQTEATQKPRRSHNTSNKATKQQSKEDIELATLLRDKIKENLPTFKEPNIDSWSSEIEKMRRIDKRTEEQIKYLIEWCQQDPFWQGNILSPSKLREKFDTLVAQVKRNKQTNSSKSITII